MKPCETCQQADQNPRSGRYSFTCPRCCARLIRSARPLRHAQEAMFAAIARQEGAPPKADILAQLKAMDAS